MVSSPNASEGVDGRWKGVRSGGTLSSNFDDVGERLRCSSISRRGLYEGGGASSSSAMGQARSARSETERWWASASGWGERVAGVDRDPYIGAPHRGNVDWLPIMCTIK
jgi:hypothetical protein